MIINNKNEKNSTKQNPIPVKKENQTKGNKTKAEVKTNKTWLLQKYQEILNFALFAFRPCGSMLFFYGI